MKIQVTAMFTRVAFSTYLGMCKLRGQLDFLQDAPMRVLAIPTVANPLTIPSSIFRDFRGLALTVLGTKAAPRTLLVKQKKAQDYSCISNRVRDRQSQGSPLRNKHPSESHEQSDEQRIKRESPPHLVRHN